MMPFVVHCGLVAPLDRANVDTDAILPKQFMKSTARVGYGPFLFDAERYLDEGSLGMDCKSRPVHPGFVLNQPRYVGASILLGRRNFGCGSSREHAPWALQEFGFRVLIAPSFGDIFYDNCLKIGLLPVVLDDAVVAQMFDEVARRPGFELTVDLQRQVVLTSTSEVGFEIAAYSKERLLAGMDEIALTLSHTRELVAFERRHQAHRPWLHGMPRD